MSGAGTTGDIERAHRRLDALGAAPGSLAERVLSLLEVACCSPVMPHAQVPVDTEPHWVVRRAVRLNSGVILWDGALPRVADLHLTGGFI